MANSDPLTKALRDVAFEKTREGIQENLDGLLKGLEGVIQVGTPGWDEAAEVLGDLKDQIIDTKDKIAKLPLPE
ncbi:MAG TPA: hypothetical protein VMT03_21200 [Polyangia bacterium]|nr:hypothetical protein [Polyangia bacterium]